MSEKFGLDWPEYDAVRIHYLMACLSAYNEKDNRRISSNLK